MAGWLKVSDRQLSGEQLIKHDTDGINIDAMIDFVRGLELLRGEVMHRPKYLPSGGNFLIGARVFDLCDPEVREFDLPIVAEQYILGLDIAVNDPFRVSVLECIRDGTNNVEGVGNLDRHRLHGFPKIETMYIFHHVVGEPVGGVTVIVDGDDVGMIEFRKGLRLSFIAIQEHRVVGDRTVDDFEGDIAVQRRLPRLVDRSHTASAYDPADIQLRKVGIEGSQGFSILDLKIGVVVVQSEFQ